MKHKTFIAVIITSLFVSFVARAQNSGNTNTALSSKEKSIIAISALTAKGNLSKLKTVLNNGLDAGLSINQIKEAIVHVYAYAGFPRSIRGLQTFMTVIEKRKVKGLNDVIGREASAIKDERNKYDRGKAILDTLLGSPQNGPLKGYSAFAPRIDTFLKEHLFADLFERDVLSYRQRELVTVSVLSGIGGVEPMLQSHFNICLNVGLAANQLQEFIGVITLTIGKAEGKSAQTILDKVLEKRSIETK